MGPTNKANQNGKEYIEELQIVSYKFLFLETDVIS